jgi:single-strand DNA-binding protein
MLNKITIIGYLGGDPDFHAGADRPKDRTNFSVAVTERWNNRAGGKDEHTEWFRCVAWGAVANIIADWGNKGMQVYVEGKIRTSEYIKDGQTKSSMSVVVDKFLMLGKKESKDDRRTKVRKVTNGPSLKSRTIEHDAYIAEDDIDDDIPF